MQRSISITINMLLCSLWGHCGVPNTLEIFDTKSNCLPQGVSLYHLIIFNFSHFPLVLLTLYILFLWSLGFAKYFIFFNTQYFDHILFPHLNPPKSSLPPYQSSLMPKVSLSMPLKFNLAWLILSLPGIEEPQPRCFLSSKRLGQQETMFSLFPSNFSFKYLLEYRLFIHVLN